MRSSQDLVFGVDVGVVASFSMFWVRALRSFLFVHVVLI
jgi:hypothetical protein